MIYLLIKSLALSSRFKDTYKRSFKLKHIRKIQIGLEEKTKIYSYNFCICGFNFNSSVKCGKNDTGF